MKTKRNDFLLNDVLAVEGEPGTHSVLLEQTLQEVRHRRDLRRRVRGGMTFGVAALILGVLLSRDSLPETQHPKSAGVGTTAWVSTLPLQPSMIIETDPGSAVVLISTSSTVERVASNFTDDAVTSIGDDELLSLTQDAPALLVREPGVSARLVVLNTASLLGRP